MMSESRNLVFFFFNDTATTEIYTLSLHDALPISEAAALQADSRPHRIADLHLVLAKMYLHKNLDRSEEHTSELQSQSNLVCRLLLEKKKTSTTAHIEPVESVCHQKRV